MSTACKLSVALLCLFAVASLLVLTAVAGNKTKQTSSNMVSQLTFSLLKRETKGKNILRLFADIMKYSSELFQGFIFRKACGGKEGN